MKHIILIGFKHVGKSAIGAELSVQIGHKFVDLDEQIQEKFRIKNGAHKPCRKIVQDHGEDFFRDLESEALQEVMKYETPCVIDLGGGTPLRSQNQDSIIDQQIVHVRAPKAVVFERIMLHGKPAFFTDDEDAFVCFDRLWNDRMKVYEKMAGIEVDNDSVLASAIDKIKSELILKPVV
jgi:shikimate kinase